MVVEIVGAPFDLGGKRLGSRLGPVAIRLAELEARLGDLGAETRDRGDVSAAVLPPEPGGFPAFAALLEFIKSLRAQVADILRAGHLPIVLGGEHTVVVGGISAALELYGPNLGALWIDAHADVNTPLTSPTHNLHGMPIGALLGLPGGAEGVRARQWKELVQAVGPQHLHPNRVAWYALRDVDLEERTQVANGFSVTMHEIDRHGVERTVERLDRFWRDSGVREVWVSFDVDALDPILAPGTGTAVRGGLTYREAHLLAELLREKLDVADCPYQLVGIDLVETNPLVDIGNETAKVAVEWIASLLGKTILGTRG